MGCEETHRTEQKVRTLVQESVVREMGVLPVCLRQVLVEMKVLRTEDICTLKEDIDRTNRQ